MSRKVEVCSNQCADSVEDVGSVMVDPDVKLLCCASNILFVAFAAGYCVSDSVDSTVSWVC